MSLIFTTGWTENLKYEDLLIRENNYYEKFSDLPYTGNVTGRIQGYFKNGKKNGSWTFYYSSGQLFKKGNFKNGKEEGVWKDFDSNGKLNSKGKFVNGKREGFWEYFKSNGKIDHHGKYVNGKMNGVWEYFKENGQLEMKGKYINNKREGFWEIEDYKYLNVNFKNGIGFRYKGNFKNF